MGLRASAAELQPEEVLRHSGTVVVADGVCLVFDPAPDVRLPETHAAERIVVLLSTHAHSETLRAIARVRRWAEARYAAVQVLVLGPLASSAPSAQSEAFCVEEAAIGEVTQVGSYVVEAYPTSPRNAGRGYVLRFTDQTAGAPARRPLLVYAGATRPCYATVSAAEGAAVMIHDASYDETEARAAGVAGYSTAGQAAVVARAAAVERLLLVPLRGVTPEARTVLEREATRLFRRTSFETGTLTFRLKAGEIEQITG